MNYGDLVKLKSGEIVRVNSIDTARKVFDYVKDHGDYETTEEAGFDEIKRDE